MSRTTKWEIEKIKVKVVFRLQFHATHIPQSGWDKLFVSFIPTDSGKIAGKTSKTNVRNGSCKWPDPIYETTRLLQDPKTKDYDEKLYKFVVAMGSSRSSLLGEVVINLADFIYALKPSSAALPLHGCNFGTILHVNVQLLTSKTGFREFEQQRELSMKGLRASSGKRIHDQYEDSPTISGTFEHIDKVNPRAKFKEDSVGLPLLEEMGQLDEVFGDLSVGVDCSSYNSESLYTEKTVFSGSVEVDGLKSQVTGDVIGFTHVHSPSTEKGDHNYKNLSTQLSTDGSHGWSSDYSIDNNLVSAYENSGILAARLQLAESSILQLKSEVMSLRNISDELSSETQNLAQQFTVELAAGKMLLGEVDILKSECWNLKKDLDELKAASSWHTSRSALSASQMKCFSAHSSFENKLVDGALDAENNHHHHAPCDFHSKLFHGISHIECKVQQIQNDACFGYNENAFKYIYSEFDILGTLIQNLKQCIAQELSAEVMSGVQTTKNRYSFGSLSYQNDQVEDAGRFFADLCCPKGIKTEKLCESLEQIELSKTEDERFPIRMSKVESYYEAIIHELEARQKQTSDQLENLMDVHSSCVFTISALQTQTQKLQEELNGQFIRFAEDRHNLESFIKELEKKAISSEMMLNIVRRNCAIAVDRLQKDLELLSFQVLSMYEANESFAKYSLASATTQHYDEHSEETELWHRDESFLCPNQKQSNHAYVGNQHEITQTNVEHNLCAILNDVSDKYNHKMLYNLSSNDENKGTNGSSLSLGLKFHVNEEPKASVNVIKLHDISSAASMQSIMLEGKDLSFTHDSLMEKQSTSSLLHSLHIQKPFSHAQICDNLESMEDNYHYPPPSSSEIYSNSEAMKDAYHSSARGNHMVGYVVCSKESHMSVDLPIQLYEDSGVELSEVLMLSLQLEFHAHVLQETLREVFPEIGHLKGKVLTLQNKLIYCTNNEEFMVLKLHTALDECRTLREAEAKCITRYDDLASTFHIMEVELSEAFNEKNLLAQKVADCDSLISNSKVYESKYKICIAEKNELKNMLKEEKHLGTCLQGKISSLIEELESLKEQYVKKCSLNSDLQKLVTDLQNKIYDLCERIVLCNQQVDSILDDIGVKKELDVENYDAIICHLEQFEQKVSCRLLGIQHEKKVAEEKIEIAQCKLNEGESHIFLMKQEFESELEVARTKLEHLRTGVQLLHIELEDTLGKLMLSKETEELHRLENKKLLSNMFVLEVELQQAKDECRAFCKKLLTLESVDEELANTKLKFTYLMKENKDLLSSIQADKEVFSGMDFELNSLKESLHYSRDKLHSEIKAREQLEVTNAELKLKVLETNQQLMAFCEQNAEFCYLKTRVLELEKEMQQYLVFCKERDEKIELKTSSLYLEIANMDYHLVESFRHSISADVELTFMRNQLYSKMAEFVVNQKISKKIFDLLMKHFDVAVSLEQYIVNEEEYMAERERLSTNLLSLESTLEALFVGIKAHQVYIAENTVNPEFEDLKGKASISEANYAKEKQHFEDEIYELKKMLLRIEELDELWLTKVELDILVIFFSSKLSEQESRVVFLEESDYELRSSKEKHIDLIQKDSEQILKTEKFNDLTINLKEFKEKADADCLDAHGKRESEGSSFVVQESLRIAFIKEQYESKIQELRSQCCVSRKCAEEMLMKLQSSLNDNESIKKSETYLSKKNEEMSVLLFDLDNELQNVMNDRREMIKAYDGMKAELECTILCFECCKEEKQKLQNSLKESSEEREKIRVELDLVKRLLENMASTTGTGVRRNYESNNLDATLIEELLEDDPSGISFMYDKASTASCICSEDKVVEASRDFASVRILSIPCEKMDNMQLTSINGQSFMSNSKVKNILQDATLEASLLENSATQIANIKEHFREQKSLINDMEFLHKKIILKATQ